MNAGTSRMVATRRPILWLWQRGTLAKADRLKVVKSIAPHTIRACDIEIGDLTSIFDFLTWWPISIFSRLLSRLVLLPGKRAATQQTEHDNNQRNLGAWRQ